MYCIRANKWCSPSRECLYSSNHSSNILDDSNLTLVLVFSFFFSCFFFFLFHPSLCCFFFPLSFFNCIYVPHHNYKITRQANANGMFTHEINSKSVWENECHEEENKNEQLKLVLCCRNNSPKDAP